MLSFSRIPGLFLFRSFLEKDAYAKLKENSLALQKEIFRNSSTGELQNCRTFISQYHNLSSEEKYRKIKIEGKNAQLFDTYGGQGHKLTYFIGNANLPAFVHDLNEKLEKIPAVSNLGKPLNWNFTFNTYTHINSTIAGFNYHKDIHTNGDVSLIYSLGATSRFHIRHPKNNEISEHITLDSNSLVVLSNEARWDFEHGVIPVSVSDSPLSDEIQRISLVLGARKII